MTLSAMMAHLPPRQRTRPAAPVPGSRKQKQPARRGRRARAWNERESRIMAYPMAPQGSPAGRWALCPTARQSTRPPP